MSTVQPIWRDQSCGGRSGKEARPGFLSQHRKCSVCSPRNEKQNLEWEKDTCKYIGLDKQNFER